MNALFNTEKTSMIQPDSILVNNYFSSKQELARISEKKLIKNERMEILIETNERLNAEVHKLKNAAKNVSQASANESGEAQLLSKLKVLDNHYRSEKKKNLLLSLKLEKLEQLLKDVYEAEGIDQVKKKRIVKALN